MSQKKTTKEERFLQKLYDLAQKTGSPKDGVDRYEVGNLVGENSKGTDNTVQMLAKNGFLSRAEGDKVCLTDRGVLFVKASG